MNDIEVGNVFRQKDGRDIAIRRMWINHETGPMIELAISGHGGFNKINLQSFKEIPVSQLSEYDLDTRMSLDFSAWERPYAGNVARLKQEINRGENPNVPAGSLGIVSEHSRLGETVGISFPAHGSHTVSREDLEPVLCEECGTGWGSHDATELLEVKDGESGHRYKPLCGDCKESHIFHELLAFLKDGELPYGCHIKNWETLSQDQTETLIWLLQVHYGFMTDVWMFCDNCHDPMNSESESITYIEEGPNAGHYCDECAADIGGYCDDCDEFFIWDDLDEDHLCKACAAVAEDGDE